jgi:DNA-binding NarL/FixJ family response regulator
MTSHGIARGPARAVPERRAGGKVVLAGGKALVRAARRSVLARSGMEVVADTADVPSAARAADLGGVGVVLVDGDVPGGCVQAVRLILEQAPAAAVLVVAPVLDREKLLATVRAGASGFVT